MVEQNIIRVLDRRVLDCEQAFGGIESSGSVEWCREVKKDLEDAQTNYMIKCVYFKSLCFKFYLSDSIISTSDFIQLIIFLSILLFRW